MIKNKPLNDQKTLLILDVDETLLFATEQEIDQKFDFKLFDYFVYKRPFLDEFLETIKDDFILAIWSSASDKYVQEVVN